MAQKKAMVLLAPGYEELEAVAVIDILRRAGIDCISVGLKKGPVASARNVKIIPDTDLDGVLDEKVDLIVLPGGIDGTEHLASDKRVVELLGRQLDQGGYVGAICAAPTVLDRHGLSRGRSITCHPVTQAAVKQSSLSQERVVQDGQVITSQGPGTAVEFALRLVAALEGEEKARQVNEGVLAKV